MTTPRRSPSVVNALVKEVLSPEVVAIVWRGTVLEATVLGGLSVSVGDKVIAIVVKSSSQYVVLTPY